LSHRATSPHGVESCKTGPAAFENGRWQSSQYTPVLMPDGTQIACACSLPVIPGGFAACTAGDPGRRWHLSSCLILLCRACAHVSSARQRRGLGNPHESLKAIAGGLQLGNTWARQRFLAEYPAQTVIGHALLEIPHHCFRCWLSPSDPLNEIADKLPR
jgi:hypothetical protein